MKKTHFKISKNILTFILIIVLVFFFFLMYFYEIVEGNGEPRDIFAHYEFAQRLLFLRDMSLQEFLLSDQYVHVLSYPVWHISAILVELIIKTVESGFGVAINLQLLVPAITNSLYVTLTFGVLSILLKKMWKVRQNTLVIYLSSVLLIFVNPYYCKLINPNYYLGQLSANVWHNPTIIAVKPFALICISIYIYLLNHRLINGNSIKYKLLNRKENGLFICFGLLLLLSALAKPNFFQIFAPALFLYCVIDVIYTKGKSFWFDLKTALSIIPTCFLAIWQLNISIGIDLKPVTDIVEAGVSAVSKSNIGIGGNSGLPTGIGMEFLMVWKLWSENIIGSALLSLLFPIYIFAISRKFAFKRHDVKIIGLTFLSALFQFMFFYLRYSPINGDFMWGVYISVFLLFLISTILLFEYKNIYGKNKKWCLGLILLLGHFISGVCYFIYLYVSGVPY